MGGTALTHPTSPHTPRIHPHPPPHWPPPKSALNPAAHDPLRDPMSDDLDALKHATIASLAQAADLRAWDAIRVGVLGKSGALTNLLKELGKAAPKSAKHAGPR